MLLTQFVRTDVVGAVLRRQRRGLRAGPQHFSGAERDKEPMYACTIRAARQLAFRSSISVNPHPLLRHQRGWLRCQGRGLEVISAETLQWLGVVGR